MSGVRYIIVLGFTFLSVIFVMKTVLLSLPEKKEVVKLLSSQIELIKREKVRVIYREVKKPEDIESVNCNAVKPVTYVKVVSLEDLTPKERKKKFIDMVLPSILVANYEVEVTRRNLIKVKEKLSRGLKLTKEEITFLESVLKRCRSDSLEDTLKKVYPVPPSLVIAQAAVETGWGTSRFFVEALNLFGMWTFREDIEYITTPGGRIKLKKYRSILDSVRDYIYTVNVGWAYEDFREFRLKDLDSIKLSGFLEFYSVERKRYVAKLRKVITANRLKELDKCRLDPAYIE